MKKTNTMRVAVLLLALALVTSCFVGGTFAKYTSSATASDNARVAYWGWNKAATIDFDLFDGEYDTTGDAATVDSENGDNVVAPGTAKEETFVFAYAPNSNVSAAAPEVDYTFAVNFEVSGDYTALDNNENFKWTLGEDEFDTVEDLQAAVKALSGDASGSKDYKHGTLPAAFATASNNAVTNTIGWYWTYSVDDDGDSDDTDMGNAQDLADVSFSITITATQLN